MARSSAATVEAYLDELSEDRRAVIAAMRDVIRARLPDGFQETMNWGMISYEIPLERYPQTYNGQPLAFAGLAAQKNYNTLYLLSVYEASEQEGTLRRAFHEAGKKLDMGKSCIRFRTLDDLQLDAIEAVIAGTTPAQLITLYETARHR